MKRDPTNWSPDCGNGLIEPRLPFGTDHLREAFDLTPQKSSYSVNSSDTCCQRRYLSVASDSPSTDWVEFRCPEDSEFYEFLNGKKHRPSLVIEYVPRGGGPHVYYSYALVVYAYLKYLYALVLSKETIVHENLDFNVVCVIDEEKELFSLPGENEKYQTKISISSDTNDPTKQIWIEFGVA